MIQLLDNATINKIAAGEVVERPSSVVKELVENAIDAKSSAVTVEIKDGGTSLIRITDNGCGIAPEEIRSAFLRHATSKIVKIEDLLSIASLGFRGEALASIAAVAQVEIISKKRQELTGVRYVIEGGKELSYQEIGCPDGTTIIVRNIFFNTPARKKFLKTNMTEGSYIAELMSRLALSRPDISFQFIMNGQNKLYTTGNGKVKDIIYEIYGKEISKNLLSMDCDNGNIKISGFLAKPYISRGNRSFENYFVNGRYIKNSIITKAIEDAYKTFVMIHKFPFTSLYFDIPSDALDINVHPAKMEMRYNNNEELYQFLYENVRKTLLSKELIPESHLKDKKEINSHSSQVVKSIKHAEPFQKERIREQFVKPAHIESKDDSMITEPIRKDVSVSDTYKTEDLKNEEPVKDIIKDNDDGGYVAKSKPAAASPKSVLDSQHTQNKQLNLFETNVLSDTARSKHRLIGQLFKTYWLFEYDHKLFIMDQHAAHEKVMYEKFVKDYKNKTYYSQQVNPPTVLTLTPGEFAALNAHKDAFAQLGYIIEDFGGNEILLRAVPSDLFGLEPVSVFVDFLDSMTSENTTMPMDIFIARLSTMACKAAIKGNQAISFEEANALIDELMTLENPYNCPHGRPTIITMSEYDIDRKFKRIQD